MTDKNPTRTPLNNPALDRAFTKALRDLPIPPQGSGLPQSRADFERLVAQAERGLRPAKRGRPAKGGRGAVTRTRSIRAPDVLWTQIEALAAARGVTVNQATVLALERLLPARGGPTKAK